MSTACRPGPPCPCLAGAAHRLPVQCWHSMHAATSRPSRSRITSLSARASPCASVRPLAVNNSTRSKNVLNSREFMAWLCGQHQRSGPGSAAPVSFAAGSWVCVCPIKSVLFLDVFSLSNQLTAPPYFLKVGGEGTDRNDEKGFCRFCQ
jgi:hypothetical protein